jgi:nucleoside-diphosphate-sugar epimerase
MLQEPRRCIVSGAGGYVGSRVSRYFGRRGWQTIAFSRGLELGAPAALHVPFALGARIEPATFSRLGASLLVHCAYDFRLTTWDEIERVNVRGSIELLQAARAGGVGTLVFISSISAFDGCHSLYGKAKLAIERAAADLGAFIVRPGLVYGAEPAGGMFGSLQKIAARLPIVPLIGSGNDVQYLVHEDDLCELMVRIGCGEIPWTARPIVAASERPWTLRTLVKMLAAPHRPVTRLVPLPWPLVWAALKTLEMCGMSGPFRSDSVLSLVSPDPCPDFSAAARIGCAFRDFGEYSAHL